MGDAERESLRRPSKEASEAFKGASRACRASSRLKSFKERELKASRAEGLEERQCSKPPTFLSRASSCAQSSLLVLLLLLDASASS